MWHVLSASATKRTVRTQQQTDIDEGVRCGTNCSRAFYEKKGRNKSAMSQDNRINNGRLTRPSIYDVCVIPGIKNSGGT